MTSRSRDSSSVGLSSRPDTRLWRPPAANSFNCWQNTFARTCSSSPYPCPAPTGSSSAEPSSRIRREGGRRILLDGSAELDPVGAGHGYGEDEQVRANVFCQQLNEFAAGGLHNLVSGRLESPTEELSRDRLVIGDQDRRGAFCEPGVAEVGVGQTSALSP